MPEQSQPSDDIDVPGIAGMSFLRFQGAADYPLLLALLTESEQADGIFEVVSLQSIERWCAPSDRFDPYQDILLALADSVAVRHFNNMLHRLNDIPDRALPAGLQVRPVQPEHYRSIWDAQKEVHRELFETVAENWTEEKYRAWLVDPSHTPQWWQVAWDGDQVAGMVLTRIDEAENRERKRKRGYTEHVFVRRPWRQRGLASALIARSLQVLKAQGMEEAELGVDSENDSGAYGFYQRMGYQTFSTDIWFRKPMDDG